MAIFSFFFLTCFVSASFIGNAQSKEPELTKFGKKVKSLLPDETYKKMFSINAKTDDELQEAIKKSDKKFAELLGIPFNQDMEDKVEKENKRLGLAHFNSSVFFHCQTYAISKGFTDLGLLTTDNIDDLAQKYVDEFNKVAKTLNKDDILSTFNAVVTAVANFLISQGVTSEKSIMTVVKAYNEEFEMYLPKKKPGLLESILNLASSILS